MLNTNSDSWRFLSWALILNDYQFSTRILRQLVRRLYWDYYSTLALISDSGPDFFVSSKCHLSSTMALPSGDMTEIEKMVLLGTHTERKSLLQRRWIVLLRVIVVAVKAQVAVAFAFTAIWTRSRPQGGCRCRCRSKAFLLVSQRLIDIKQKRCIRHNGPDLEGTNFCDEHHDNMQTAERFVTAKLCVLL